MQIMKVLSHFRFQLPHQIPASAESQLVKKVCVISFWGKSAYSDFGCKAARIDDLLSCQIFCPDVASRPDPLNLEAPFELSGFYSQSERCIFLHLRGVYDPYILSQLCSEVCELDDHSFLGTWGHGRYHYARALLFLFSVSHVLVVCNPSPTFDLTYVHFFRALECARLKLQGHVGRLIQDIPGLPKDWSNHGRLCSPRVLFLFERCPRHLRCSGEEEAEKARKVVEVNGAGGKGGGRATSRNPPIKKLEMALEDQIYHVLRRSRVITNISANSLFAIPANLEFVYMCNDSRWMTDPAVSLVDELTRICREAREGASAASLASALAAVSVSGPHTFPDVPSKEIPEHSFHKFLHQHIHQAMTKGFEDNVGRHVAPSFFEIPSATAWFQAANRLYEFFTGNSPESDYKSKQVFSNLRASLDVDVRFSEGRSAKVLPLALAAYQDKLPSHYTQAYHETKLGRAITVLCLHARGPACERYVTQLEDECDNIWRNGRQMCEALSLRGNHCTNPVHQVSPDEDAFGDEDKEKSLTVMPHSSGVRYVTVCNCGRKQATRDDPFLARSANYDFYSAMAKECCFRLESFSFPVFQPSIKEYKAAMLSPSGREIKEGEGEAKKNGAEGSNNTKRGPSPGVELSYAGPSGGNSATEASRMSNQPAATQDIQQSATEQQKVVINVTECNTNEGKDKWLVRQPSTTEYLPGMLHTESPPGLLPRFPSWSLVCLGPSSLYSHNSGLHHDQPGFLPGTSYLLPWDVTIKVEKGMARESKERGWKVYGGGGGSGKGGGKNKGRGGAAAGAVAGAVAGAAGGAGSSRADTTGGGPGEVAEIMVKIFIGVEYECPRGHRFMCTGPDKVLRTTGAGLVKDTANRVTSSDMPLYFPCPCSSNPRNNKQLTAQLMRIHVVTPKAPVHVTVNPRVQPAPNPCPVFVCGVQEPIKLTQSAYWVLRLPYSYVSDQGPYLPPKEPFNPGFGRVLKGVYGIVPMSTSD